MRVKFHEWKIKEISLELDSANGHWKQIRLKKSKTIKKKVYLDWDNFKAHEIVTISKNVVESKKRQKNSSKLLRHYRVMLPSTSIISTLQKFQN